MPLQVNPNYILGAWRNGRRYGLRQLSLAVRNPSSVSSQIQGNLILYFYRYGNPEPSQIK